MEATSVRASGDGVVRAMLTPQTDGNCVNCHTEVGASAAPGRILVPQ